MFHLLESEKLAPLWLSWLAKATAERHGWRLASWTALPACLFLQACSGCSPAPLLNQLNWEFRESCWQRLPNSPVSDIQNSVLTAGSVFKKNSSMFKK